MNGRAAEQRLSCCSVFALHAIIGEKLPIAAS